MTKEPTVAETPSPTILPYEDPSGPRSTKRWQKVLVLKVVRRRRRYRLRSIINWLGSWVMFQCVLLNVRLGRSESES